jgi:beta-glucosidase
MPRSKLVQLALVTAIAGLSVSACSLPTPKGAATTDGSSAVACSGAEDAGVPDAGSSVIATGDVENVVKPKACAGNGSGNPNAIDIYSQGYAHDDPMITNQVNQTLGGMSIQDETIQMYGQPYLLNGGDQHFDIESSQDTASLRGFRYRDASRGMNLAEDMDGVLPSAGTGDGQSVGYSTEFPVSMARGAAFDMDLEYAVGEAIGDEMQAAKQTLLLAPCMNLLRHPFWGRAQETYGEDSFQVGRLASAMTVGIQKHIAANAKHYLAYDVEYKRANNDSEMDEQTLREIYGRHFRMVVQDAGVASVMASYNAVNGKKSTQSVHILTDVLRTDFGFKGFVLSDWWALPAAANSKTDTSTLQQQALTGVTAGLDVELPWGLVYGQIENLYNIHKITKQQLDTSVGRILYEKFRFNAGGLTGNVGLGSPITTYSFDESRIICGDGPHLALAKRAAVESMVLLKNSGVLPISPAAKKIAVVGATVPYVVNNGAKDVPDTVNFAVDVRGGDLGSSKVFPDPGKSVGPVDGICLAAGGTPDLTTHVCTGASVTAATTNKGDLAPVMAAASAADFVVVMAGLTPQDEGEEYTDAADRDFGLVGSNPLALDAKQRDGTYQNIQNKLITAVAATGKPMVVVLEGGSVIDVPWLNQVPALVMAWYPGQRGGEALGDLLFGQVGGESYNFAGKLPFTWGTVSQYGDPFNDPSGVTQFSYYIGYRYFDHNGLTPVFPFGAGLSYTTFELSNLQLGCSSMAQGAVLPVVVNVKNTGMVAGDEIVMVFVSFPNTAVQRRQGQKELKGFARVSLAAGEAKQVTIPVRLSDLDYFQMDSPTAATGHWVVESGPVKIMVGDSATSLPLSAMVNVNGYTVGPAQ